MMKQQQMPPRKTRRLSRAEVLKVIAGLGNPGQQYSKTRHNAGFWFLEGLAAQAGVTWVFESRFEGRVAALSIAGGRVFLLQPQTYMNHSGRALGKLVRYYKVYPEEILVVHDELDFGPGLIKLKKAGGHAGHNGLRDIIAHLGSRDFYRMRVGIGRPEGMKKVSDYVLSEPSAQDKQAILTGFEDYFACLEQLVSGDIEQVMNRLHSK